MTRKEKLLLHQRQTTRQLMGITRLTEHGAVCSRDELLFYLLRPDNLSILSPEGIRGRVRALTGLLQGMTSLELLALDSRESFLKNKQYYQRRLEEEPEPALRELLRQNHVADEMTNYCVKFQRVFQEQFQDPAIRKTFFYYQEDLLDFAAAPQALDTALTALTGKPVFVSRAARRELLVNLRSCCGEDSPAVRIVSKENVIVHDALGDAITLWVKRGDWYLIFYPGDHTDARLIIDSLACTLRYDLYYSTLLNVPAAPAETAAFLSRAISILDEGTATI